MKKDFHIPVRARSDSAALTFQMDSPWLAPLAGYSDLPFRVLCRELGAEVCETEMVSAKGIVCRSRGSDDLLKSSPRDYPLIVQLFGGEAESMGMAVHFLRQKGYDAFDCNMGCPVRKVLRQKAGAALLEDQKAALAIARAMLKNASSQGPELPETPAKVGFKLRLNRARRPGFAAELGRRLEDLGAAWLCLHPRTAEDGYGGKADWEEIANLCESVAIPVIASGDLFAAEDGIACLRQTGASAVMYARGALASPFVFRQHKLMLAGLDNPTLERKTLVAIIKRHIVLARDSLGDRRAFARMRSIIPRYVRCIAGVSELRQNLCHCEDWESLGDVLDVFMERSRE